MDNTGPISVHLKALRRRSGLSQSEAARLGQVSLSFLRKVEQGRGTLSLEALDRYLKVYGLRMWPQRLNAAPEAAE